MSGCDEKDASNARFKGRRVIDGGKKAQIICHVAISGLAAYFDDVSGAAIWNKSPRRFDSEFESGSPTFVGNQSNDC